MAIRGLTRSTTSGSLRAKVIGVPQAIAKLRLVGSVAARDSGLIVLHTAYKVRDEARKNVHSSSNPYSSDYAYTDSLRNGIQLASGGRAGGLGAYTQMVTASSRAGGADKEYAQYEENGTSQNPAHPYLRPAVSQALPSAVSELKLLAKRLESL